MTCSSITLRFVPTPVVGILQNAARDPNVLAIKSTLYRVGRNSPWSKMRCSRRAENGKQVAVLVELKARFDEERIGWAGAQEYGGSRHVRSSRLKMHSKIALVVRREGDSFAGTLISPPATTMR